MATPAPTSFYGEEEDDDALGRVGHGLRDGTEGVEHAEAALVVRKVAEAAQQQPRRQTLAAVLGGLQRGERRRSLGVEGGQQEQRGGAAGEERVRVDRVEVVAHLHLLGHDPLSEQLGDGKEDSRRERRERRERHQLGQVGASAGLGRGVRHAAHDRQEGEVDVPRRHLALHHQGDQRADEGLGRLDHSAKVH
eukprot:scaffold1455_cov65-Phaeocystis_antarctica.AAC.12